MLVHQVFAVVRRVLPGRVAGGLRRIVTALLTPWVFSINSGHFRSSMRSRAVDPRGRPLPWYTYPAIEFLSDQDYSSRTVLEFGAGQSTLWWASRAREVVALESDPAWYRELARCVPANVTLVSLPLTLEGLDELLGSRSFDIVIVDGLDRLRAAGESLERVSQGGMVVVDDSESFWSPEGSYPIIDIFRSGGFRRVDFYGYAPGVILPRCTSVFFRDGCFVTEGRGNPRRLLA